MNNFEKNSDVLVARWNPNVVEPNLLFFRRSDLWKLGALFCAAP